VIRRLHLGGELCWCHGLVVVGGVGCLDEGHAGAGEDVEAEVAAAFDPLVVLFCEDGADEADEGAAVGERHAQSATAAHHAPGLNSHSTGGG